MIEFIYFQMIGVLGFWGFGVFNQVQFSYLKNDPNAEIHQLQKR